MTKRRDDRRRLPLYQPAAGRGARSRGRRERSRPLPRSDAWRPVMRRRLLAGVAFFALWLLVIEVRLVHLQVIRRDHLVELAQRQQNRSITAHPQRGEIKDRAGRVLAYSVDADTIYAAPTDVEDPAATADALCRALACGAERRRAIEERLGRNRGFAYVARKVSPDVAWRVAALELDGVGFLKEDRRYYPNKEMAAHLLGYVGIDSQGLSGVESAYDHEIRGRPGKVLIQTDARRQVFGRVERPPTAGATIELTIDKYLQHIAERELRAAVREHGADGGAVVVMDPRTGELLALANEPTFNPNAFADSPTAALRNRAVQDIYEPGSVFKIVTTSAALEEGAARRDELFDVSAGFVRIGGADVLDMVTHDVLSFEDVVVKSSNVGTIEVGLRIGPERLSRYVRRFGFGRALSPDLPGQSPGIVHRPDDLDERGVASLSMGYQVAVTPLQLAVAVSAAANGGVLMEPRAVRAVIRDGVREERPSRVIRRAIAQETAAELTGILEAVVERGTARSAGIPGFTVAGKTGTAEKVIDGRYSDVDHNATFVGFVPSRAPAITVAVMIDTPRGAAFTGGAVAAPVFRRIAEASLRQLGVPPTSRPNPAVLARTPAPPSPAVRRAPPQRDAAAGRRVMPDLRGLSARRALEAIGPLRVGVRVAGDGFVTSHEPGPGAAVDYGSTVALHLERRPEHPPGC